MPLRKVSREAPPEPMTWGRALPKLVVAGVFDALGLMCETLWFFGPAFAGVACTAGVSTYLPGSLATLICGAGATLLGYAGAGALIPMGTVLSMAVQFMGWLTLGLWLFMTNNRIFKSNALWFASSLLLEEIPLLNALPMLTGVLIKMYATQIKAEKEAYRKYQEEQAQFELEEQKRMEAQLLAERLQTEAANEAAYLNTEAANQDEYTAQEEAANDEEYGEERRSA